MNCTFIAAPTLEFRTCRMCHALGVQWRGYYACRRQNSGSRAQANEKVLEMIRPEHETSPKTYSSPSIWISLHRKGVVCEEPPGAVDAQAWDCELQKRKWHPTATQRQLWVICSPNRLNQEFTSPAPNLKWVSDITFFDTADGWMYLATGLDLFSRKVVGWAMTETMDTALVEAAWRMALVTRQSESGLLHHSYQGNQ